MSRMAESEADDAQQPTQRVGERQEEAHDAQRSTSVVGERPSQSRGVRDIDLILRNQRDSLITHKTKETNRVR